MSRFSRRLIALAGLAAVGTLAALLGTIRATGLQPRHSDPRVEVPAGDRLGTQMSLPVAFEVNRGQARPDVKFLGQARLGTAAFAAGRVELSAAGEPSHPALHLSLRWVGGNPSEPVGTEPLPGTVNYFLGNQPSRWLTGISTYKKVRYSGIYPGVDAVFYGDQRDLEYDLELAPGVEGSDLKLAIDGAERLEVSSSGDLLISAAGQSIVQRRPRAYQAGPGGRRQELEVRYIVHGQEVLFEVNGRDARWAVTIDPTLVYSTYYGGSSNDMGFGMAVDSSGDMYLVGSASSTNLPFTGSGLQPFKNGTSDAFILKLNDAGTAALYATYLGGSGQEMATAVAADNAGNAFFAGFTSSVDFPISGTPFQSSYDGGTWDMFVAALNPAGTGLVFSTYIGGAGEDQAHGIALDSSGIYIAGESTSANFPATTSNFAPDSGVLHATLTKINLSGSGLIYSSRFGGGGGDRAWAVAVDSSGSAYVTGNTSSSDFPTVNPVQATLKGSNDCFVSKIDPSGATLLYSTFLGGTASDYGQGIAVTSGGEVFVTGGTVSTNFPIHQAFHPNCAQCGSSRPAAFVAKLSNTGSSLVFSTYLGGLQSNDWEEGYAVAVDHADNAWVTGETFSPDFPTVYPVSSGTGAFLTAFSGDGGVLLSTVMTSSWAYGEGIAVDAFNNIYVGGQTETTISPLVNPLQSTNHGSTNAFIARLSNQPRLTSASPGACGSTGGAPIQLNGANLLPSGAITFDGVPVTVASFPYGSSVSVTAPPHAPGRAVVVYTAFDNELAVLDGGFLYTASPVISSVSPSVGATMGGDAITVTGANFASGATLVFSSPSQSATATSVIIDGGGTTLTAITPAHVDGGVDVIVSNPDFGRGILDAGFTFVPMAPVVTSASPDSGSILGGTTVTIQGSHFPCFGQVSVAFGANAASSLFFGCNPNVIQAQTPANDAGLVDVVVTNTKESLTGTLTGGFLYRLPPPSVSTFAPTSGSTLGGTAVVVSGSYFQPGANVTFGAVGASNVVFDGGSQLIATTPPQDAGIVFVNVTNPDGQTSNMAFFTFTYYAPPSIVALSPNTGPTAGGTPVVISGANFRADAGVTIGGAAVTASFKSAASIQIPSMPAGPAGAAPVVVTNPDLQASNAALFSYIPPPIITGVVPSVGSSLGGTSVTLSGSAFLPGATVTFGAASSPSATVSSSTTIVAVAPANPTGPATVKVINPDGQLVSVAGQFTYDAPPSIGSVTPTTGASSGGTQVSISGGGFQGSTVYFGGALSRSSTVNGTGSITAVAPAHAPGAVDVVVTNGDLLSTTASAAFTYVAGPGLSSISPTLGPIAGGTHVTLTGSNFDAASTVTLGGLPAANVVVDGGTSLACVTPGHGPGKVDVVVTNGDGQAATIPVGYTYTTQAPPVIASAVPSSGPMTGGTQVTLTGQDFTAGASVTFGGAAAAVSNVTATSISVSAPPHASAQTAIPVDVQVTNNDGQADVLQHGFTYTPTQPPTLVSASPSAGTTSGGTVVTLTGTNFTAGVTVTFGAASGLNVSLIDSSTLTATTPAHAAGVVDVVIANPDGQRATLTNGFSYRVALRDLFGCGAVTGAALPWAAWLALALLAHRRQPLRAQGRRDAR